ncbi:cysteine-rich venom protein 6-like [Leptopilina boulardi]|uniref:cysteine-rich venom protein 6-like n=1 Tax=Leptopilina boulardi TaxID=63433 RepID=UPI0021F5244A|nr:cysteine-rich venom protein 6-like [Leptopilina boulardi]
MSPIFIITLFIALVASTYAQPEAVPFCGPHAIWRFCAPVCPRTCEGLIENQPTVCPTICRGGCVCVKGYIRVSRTNSTCIKNCACPWLPYQ